MRYGTSFRAAAGCKTVYWKEGAVMIPNHWNKESYQIFIEDLASQADRTYADFQKKLMGSPQNLAGIRLPVLRRLAKQIANGDYQQFIVCSGNILFEEVMLAGLVIGYIKGDITAILQLTEKFLPRINNWAVCDSFCTGLRASAKNQQEMYDFITSYLDSEHEFSHRFALVMLMDYFICEAYIDRVLKIYIDTKSNAYYVQMAAAWGLAECFVKFQDKTMAAFQSGACDKTVYVKALQKIIESKRVDGKTKLKIRAMKSVACKSLSV